MLAKLPRDFNLVTLNEFLYSNIEATDYAQKLQSHHRQNSLVKLGKFVV